ncbi:hypothetical protein AAGS61_17685 [Lysinibacillus sp. KU-BSD001]|uniref:hypothetical protein n=1 Tax=Lysinibacillus sp. KU-BSD001 TaxID=3141328 RepID=UPI0036E085DB
MVNFTFKKRKELLELLTEQQREFIEENLKVGRKTLFMRFMQSEKVSVIKMTDDITLEEIEKQSQDWKIVDYRDYGLGNRAGKCACGKTLRYEFIVEHAITKKRIHYGKDHLADFLNIDVSDIDAIINGLHEVNYEADELLLKIQNNEYGYEIIELLSNEVVIPTDVQVHLDHNVPLLDRQIKRLLKMLEVQYLEEQRRTQFEKFKQIMENVKKQKYKDKLDVVQSVNEQFIFTNKLTTVDIAEIAYQFVVNGISSATTISHIIRDHYNVPKEYSKSVSRRPRIYADVLRALHSYAEKGLIYHDKESSGIKDSYFFPSPL